MNYLLDTDICIYLLNGRTIVRDRILAVEWNNLYICSITIAELYFGAYNSSQVVNNLARAEQFISNIAILSLKSYLSNLLTDDCSRNRILEDELPKSLPENFNNKP